MNARLAVAFITLVLSGSVGAAEKWVTLDFESNTDYMKLGEGLDLSGTKHGPCFVGDSSKVQKIGNSLLAVSLIDHESSSKVKSSTTTSMSSSGGANFGFWSAEGDGRGSKLESRETNIDQRRLDVILDAVADTESETWAKNETDPINSFGKGWAARGFPKFQENCGALVATELIRTVRIRTVITLIFSSIENKRSAITNMDLATSGGYTVFSGKGDFVRTWDSYSEDVTTQTNINVSMKIRAANGIAPAAAMLGKYGDVSKAPFSTAIAGMAAILDEMKNDPGAVEKIRLLPSQELLPQLHTLPWSTKADFLDTATKTFLALKQLDEIYRIYWSGRDQLGNSMVRRNIEAACAKYRNSMILTSTRDVPQLNVDCFADQDGVEKYSKRLATAIDACLGAVENESVLCTDEVIALSILPYLSNEYNDAFFVTETMPNIGPVKNRRIEKHQLPGIQKGIYVQMVDGYFAYPLNPNTIKQAAELLRCCTSWRKDMIERFVSDVAITAATVYAPPRIEPYATPVNEGVSGAGSLIDFSTVYAGDIKAVWFRPDQEIIFKSAEFISKSGPSIDYVLAPGDVPFVVVKDNLFFFWWGDTATCLGIIAERRPAKCEAKSSSANALLNSINSNQASIFFNVETISGPARILGGVMPTH